MIPFSQLFYYIISVFILIVIPGPTMLYLVSRTLSQGWKSGIISLLGVLTGDFFYIISVILGISSILINAPQVFNYIKILGAVYLIYLAYKTIKLKPNISKKLEQSFKKDNFLKLFSVGLLTNISNPKVALFFVAIFSQFINEKYGKVWVQSAFLGIVFILISFVVNALFIFGASKTNSWLEDNPKIQWLQQYITAFILVFLGIKMITTIF